MGHCCDCTFCDKTWRSIPAVLRTDITIECTDGQKMFKYIFFNYTYRCCFAIQDIVEIYRKVAHVETSNAKYNICSTYRQTYFEWR